MEKVVELDYREDTLLKLLIDGPKSKREMMGLLGISSRTFKRALRSLRDAGYEINYNRSAKHYQLGGLTEIEDREQRIIEALSRYDLTERELDDIIGKLTTINPNKYVPAHLDLSDYSVKFGVISDTHIGHKNYRPDILDKAIEYFVQEEVDFVVNAGDTLEGMSGREGHIYELDHLGAAQQLKAFEKEWEKFEDAGLTVYSIEGEKSHSSWYSSKGNAGLDIGEEMELRSPAYKFIGYLEQDINLESGLKIRLRHPGGGTAYAVSYKSQKYIESLPPDERPHILIQGHFHKSLYQLCGGIHAFEAGCLQQQSPYMKKKGSPAHLGFWVIEVGFDKEKQEIDRIRPEFVPFHNS